MVQKYSEKSDYHLRRNKKRRNKKREKQNQKKGRRQLLGNCVWLSGRTYIVERRTIQRRVAALVKAKKTKTKQNETNATPEKDDMTSANQTPGGYTFVALVASQPWQANQHEPACFGPSSPWSFPSRSGVLLHAVVQPWLFLQRSI